MKFLTAMMIINLQVLALKSNNNCWKNSNKHKS